MRKVICAILAVDVLMMGVAVVAIRPDRALRIATGEVSHTLCAGVFVSGQPAEEVFRQVLQPDRSLARMGRALRYQVDPARKQVVARIAGLFESRSVYRPATGCLLLRGRAPTIERDDPPREPPSARLVPEIAGPAVVEPADGRLRLALDRAFAEPGRFPPRSTQAVVVLHQGRIIAERYAPGVGVHTPLWGHSVTKSVVNALIGILVRQKRLAVEQPAPIPAWHGPGDRRGTITIDQLLRMLAGFEQDERRAGWDAATRMWYLEPDMGAFAERAQLVATPGTRFAYSNLGYQSLSRIIRDAVGGRTADVLRFARHELFEPVGMTGATLEFDVAGTPVGSSHCYASAREWARFGLLYLDDGVAGDRRILPEGWVRYSSTPTRDSGYGAGFRTDPHRWGMAEAPGDTFFGQGALGQFLVVIPSRQLVIIRLGQTRWPSGDIEGVGRLVADVVAALD